MITIKVPATSANLGPGFDTFGIALSLYNTFKVDISDHLEFINCEEKYCNENNLFYIAYKKVCDQINVDSAMKVEFDTQIPVSRGLGSSASLIVAGAFAANALHHSPLSKEELFRLCTEIEGHPDNIAPCIYGGLCVSIESPLLEAISFEVSESVHFTTLIPDYPLSTHKARAILPKQVVIEDAVFNMSHAVCLIEALKTGNAKLLHNACKDRLHVPYRKSLIHDYDTLENICLEAGACVFTISGAGPTCLAISTVPHFSDCIRNNIKQSIRILDLTIDKNGVTIL